MSDSFVKEDENPVSKLDEVYKMILDQLVVAFGRVREKWLQLVEFFCAFAEKATDRARELFEQFTVDEQAMICVESGKRGLTFNFCCPCE